MPESVGGKDAWMHLELEKTDGFLFLNIFPEILKKYIHFWAQTKCFFHAFNKDTIKEHATAVREIWCKLKPSSS